MIRALYKADRLPPGLPPPGAAPDAIPISARTGAGIPALLAAIERHLTLGLERVRCELPAARGDVLAWLRASGRILEEYYRDGLITVTALVPPKVAGQLRKRLC